MGLPCAIVDLSGHTIKLRAGSFEAPDLPVTVDDILLYFGSEALMPFSDIIEQVKVENLVYLWKSVEDTVFQKIKIDLES